MINKYTMLKNASNVLGHDLKDMAAELEITFQHFKDVAKGHRKSKRVEKYIDIKISDALKIIDQYLKQNV